MPPNFFFFEWVVRGERLSSICELTDTYIHVLEKATAPHSSTLTWKIPWTEEPGRLQSMGSLRVRHDWATALSLFTFIHWRRKWQPSPVSSLENPRDRGAWWAAVYGVAQSRTRLKWLSSSSNVSFTLSIRPILSFPHCVQSLFSMFASLFLLYK